MHLIRMILPLVTLLLGSCLVTDASPSKTTNPPDNPSNNVTVPATVPPATVSPATVSPALPVLQPSESVPDVGTYHLTDIDKRTGKPCYLRASMGVEFVVSEKNKTPSYYNVDPTTTTTSGSCQGNSGTLSLAIAGDRGKLEFTFKQEGNVSYLTTVRAFLHPAACKKCNDKIYPGIIDHEKLLKTSLGRSFRCVSQTVFHLSDDLQVKIAPLQVQAFRMTNDKFGEVVECQADIYKRIIPIILGAAAVGLLLIATVTFLVIRSRRQGYQRI